MMNKVDVMQKKLNDLGQKYKGLNFTGENKDSQRSLERQTSRFSRSGHQVKSNA